MITKKMEDDVRVLSAYKQGYSWLYDVVRPALEGRELGGITIRFAESGPPSEWSQQAMHTPVRWLKEIFPIDEVLAKAGVVKRRKVTGDPRFEAAAAQAGGRYTGREIEISDALVTARDEGAGMRFGKALAEIVRI